MVAPVSRIQLDKILPLVYEELRGCASRALSNERKDHTFQTTELVHEAYVRLAKLREIDWHDKHDVMRAAVGVMRRVLIDHARAHRAQKRNSGRVMIDCPVDRLEKKVNSPEPIDLVALDSVLEKLRELDERKAEIVELRYFGGLTIENVSEVLSISVATVKRDWAFTRAWLHRELAGEV